MPTHIHSGECALNILQAILDGRHETWTDNCFEGPLPDAAWTSPDWQTARAMGLSAYLGNQHKAGILYEKRHRATLEALRDTDEIILWFDSCLYDMMLLCSFLVLSAPYRNPETPISLICEEVDSTGRRFAGYGELPAEELLKLYPRRRTLTPRDLDEAAMAWKAFTAPTPEPWLELANGSWILSPFLAPAAHRLLEQLPCSYTALNRLEREILSALLEGHCTPLALFTRISSLEERPYFGDTVVWKTLNTMTTSYSPLVELHGPFPQIPLDVFPEENAPVFNPSDWTFTSTLLGMRSLWGWGQGIGGHYAYPRWLANVRLSPDNDWRWDRWNKKVVLKNR